MPVEKQTIAYSIKAIHSRLDRILRRMLGWESLIEFALILSSGHAIQGSTGIRNFFLFFQNEVLTECLFEPVHVVIRENILAGGQQLYHLAVLLGDKFNDQFLACLGKKFSKLRQWNVV